MVDQWTFILGCVRVVHVNIENELLGHVITQFHQVYPNEREISYGSEEYSSCGISVFHELGAPTSWIDVVIFNVRRHSYICTPYITVLPRIWWDSDMLRTTISIEPLGL